MLTWEEDVEAAALRARGWSIAAIARHLGRDPKTIRAYLTGERTPGKRRSSAPDGFAPFVDYVAARLGEDRHLWATALYDEVRSLGYRGSYPSFTRALRNRGLRPRCEGCAGVKGRETVDIAHPPGQETQWDWVELPGAPWGGVAYVLVGALSYSSQARAVLSEATDLPHLVEALDGVARRFGGITRRWRFDRMATVVDPATGRLQPSFAPVAKHYQVGVDPCPPRRANRKGVVEKAIHFLTQRWWRTARLGAATQVQASLDRFCGTTGDGRPRPGGRTVGELAETEPLRPLPLDPFPATVAATRVVAANCLVAFRGNHYSVPPGLVGQRVVVRHRLGTLELTIHSPAGVLLAGHRLAPPGAGRTLRLPAHAVALEQVVLAAFTTQRPCQRKVNRPPGTEALRADRRRGERRPCPLRRARHRSRPMTTPTSTAATGSAYQQLRGHLHYLRLDAAAEALPAQLDQAAAERLSHTTFLQRLLAIEVHATEARRHASRLRFAAFPAPWRLEDFDFDAQPAVDRALVAELATLRFLTEKANCLLIGPPGVGKTHLALALGHLAVDAGYRVSFVTAAELVARCHRAALEGRWATTMRSLAGPGLLIIDELGYLPLPSEGAAALFQVVAQRYLKGSIVLTTNRGIASWGQIFDDPMVAAAMLDRLLHRCTVLHMAGTQS